MNYLLYFLEFFEEFITDNLGVKNIDSFNKKMNMVRYTIF